MGVSVVVWPVIFSYSSCLIGKKWEAVAEEVRTRNSTQCHQRWTKCLLPGLRKGRWSEQEDQLLKRLVGELGTNWPKIAGHWPTAGTKGTASRTIKQIRERWTNKLDPNIKKTRWDAEEDRQLLDLHKRIGNSWSKIATHLPGRVGEGVKTRFRTLKRRGVGTGLTEGNTDVCPKPVSKKQKTMLQSAFVSGLEQEAPLSEPTAPTRRSSRKIRRKRGSDGRVFCNEHDHGNIISSNNAAISPKLEPDEDRIYRNKATACETTFAVDELSLDAVPAIYEPLTQGMVGMQGGDEDLQGFLLENFPLEQLAPQSQPIATINIECSPQADTPRRRPSVTPSLRSAIKSSLDQMVSRITISWSPRNSPRNKGQQGQVCTGAVLKRDASCPARISLDPPAPANESTSSTLGHPSPLIRSATFSGRSAS
jgi:hypothetical protein